MEDAADRRLVETLDRDVIRAVFLCRPMAVEALGPCVEQWTTANGRATSAP